MLKSLSKKKVFVGVSGGVDSSVAAALLKDQGYDVTGVFIRTWQPDWIICTWRDERRDAMRVCAHLDIPFVELNLEKEYKQGVADYMIAEYRAGRTPNPDVMCNREVKFGGFLSWALGHGADSIATGHYAQNIDGTLVKGADPAKDQSYFLWTLSADQLKHVLFPVGGLQKPEVRRLAEKYRLPTAAKKDSQGICFIGEIDMRKFLEHYIDAHPGDVLNAKGEVVGRHAGALFYTLGERHGFEIFEKGTDDRPLYVVAKDVAKNTITVSETQMPLGASHEIILTQCIWRSSLEDKKYSAEIRYHAAGKPCRIVIQNDADTQSALVIFDDPHFLLASGQSVVIYDGAVCVGGGIVQ